MTWFDMTYDLIHFKICACIWNSTISKARHWVKSLIQDSNSTWMPLILIQLNDPIRKVLYIKKINSVVLVKLPPIISVYEQFIVFGYTDCGDWVWRNKTNDEFQNTNIIIHQYIPRRWNSIPTYPHIQIHTI